MLRRRVLRARGRDLWMGIVATPRCVCSLEGVKLNTKQRALVGVLGLAGVALGLDRFVFGGGVETAGAAVTELRASVAQALTRTENTAAKPEARKSGRVQTITDRVEVLAAQVSGPETGLDAFSRPASWRTEPPVAVQVAAKEPEAAGPEGLKLSMVMRPAGDEEAGVAVINGKPQAVGSEIDGWTVSSITSERVFLKRGQRVAELVLPQAGGMEPGKRR